MSTLKVTSEQLVSISQSLNSGSDQVQQQLNSLRSMVAPIATEWEGAASASFQELWQEWENAGRQLQDALNGISLLLNRAGQTYQSTEDAIRASMQR